MTAQALSKDNRIMMKNVGDIVALKEIAYGGKVAKQASFSLSFWIDLWHIFFDA